MRTCAFLLLPRWSAYAGDHFLKEFSVQRARGASFILHYVRLSIFELAGRFFGRCGREEEREIERVKERKKGKKEERAGFR